MTVRTTKLLPMMAATVMSLAAIPGAAALADPAGLAHRSTKPSHPGVPGWQQVGEATYYSSKYNGRRTANGQRYNPNAMTAAHPFLPLGTRLRVQAEATGRSVVVVVTDRQTPNGRVLDLSRRAAESLDIIHAGRARVRLVALSEDEDALDPPAELAGASTPAPWQRPAGHRRSARGASVSRHLHARRTGVHALHAAATEARPHHPAHRHGPAHPVS